MIDSLRRIFAILRKETVQLLRDRLSFGMVFGLPVMQLLLFGYAITRTKEPYSSRVRELAESIFEVMMVMAQGVLKLLPYGVFALMVKVVAGTGFGVFKESLRLLWTCLMEAPELAARRRTKQLQADRTAS